MYIIVTFAVTVLLGSYVIAANNNITVYGPATIEEGQTFPAASIRSKLWIQSAFRK